MKERICAVSDFIIYWSIVIMPFSVAIAPGLANTFIGLFCGFFIIKRVVLKKSLFENIPGLLPFMALIIISLLSFKNSVSLGASLGGIVKLLKYLLIMLVCAQEIRDVRQIKRIVLTVCCGVSLISLDALWQMYSGRDFIHGNIIQQAIGLPRPTASFPNPNVMGVYLSALVPLIIGLALFYYKGIKKFIFGLICAVGAIGIATTLSRGTGLGLYLSTLFLSFMKKSKIIIAVLLAVILIFPFVMPGKIKQWAKDVNYNFIVFMCNPDRVYIYKTSINMIKAHPFLGVGVNTFSKNYGKYKIGPEEKGWESGETKYAHNNFLHLGGETGLLGLAAFLWFLFIIFKQGFLLFRKLSDEYLKAVAVSLLACFIGFLVNGLTETSLYYPRVVMIFWYLIGISLALHKFAGSCAQE